MANEDRIINDGCSYTTHFQTAHHEGTNTTSPIMQDVSVQTSLTSDSNISDGDFEILHTMKTYVKNHEQEQSAVRKESRSQISLLEADLPYAFGNVLLKII